MGDQFDEVVKAIANAKGPVCVTAAAGCGKTEAIVRAVDLAKGKQLILTHTNAGVAALRSRLQKCGIPESRYRVDTIDSWMLKYAAAYPSMSGLENTRPQGDDWSNVRNAANRLFEYPFMRDVLLASYTGVFVDEYQDCIGSQHQILRTLTEYLPVRVLGDPLQGIFRFGNNTPVDWDEDVKRYFYILPDLVEPHRWARTNPVLGTHLAEIRERLLANQPIDLANHPEIQWYQWSEQEETNRCHHVSQSRTGTIAGIHQWPNDAHNAAKAMGGSYQSIEEMDCKDLMNSARQIDRQLQQSNHQAVISEIKNLILKTCGKRNPFGDHNYLQSEFVQLGKGDLSAISKIMESVIGDPSMQTFRRELLIEMKRTAQEYATNKYSSFEEAAFTARYKTRVNGRKPENRIISRTLLVKGLEFDHAIVLNANKLRDRENLYVAMTRGAKSLTVLSQAPVISFSTAR